MNLQTGDVNNLSYIAANSSKTQDIDSRINVALVLRDQSGTYTQHAAVVLASIFANTQSDVCVYIIHDDTPTQENMLKLRQTADSFGQEIQFINAESILKEKSFGAGRLAHGGHRGKLLKLLIPELIDVPKLIYLDCDIVVKLDLSELWTVDIGNKSMGAANDVWSLDRCKDRYRSWWRSMTCKAMGVAESSYFNSGVLVMNLDKIRNHYDLISEASSFYKKYGKITKFTDQDCFNYIFARDAYIVDEKFNRIDFSDIEEQDRATFPCVWHMAGSKPWEAYTRQGVDEHYWRYLAITPWGNDMVGLLCAGLKGLQSSEFYHRHSKDCRKRLRERMASNILRTHIWTVPYLFFAILMRRFQR